MPSSGFRKFVMKSEAAGVPSAVATTVLLVLVGLIFMWRSQGCEFQEKCT